MADKSGQSLLRLRVRFPLRSAGELGAANFRFVVLQLEIHGLSPRSLW